MQLAIRVDIDTRIGLREGVPRLLDLFSRYSLRASFFVSLGPDRSGRALRRVFQPGFLQKMWRTNPFRLYGMRTLLSGTLLPGRPIGEESRDILRRITNEGHELGIHGYDHVRWQDRLEKMGEPEIASELHAGVEAYESLLDAQPRSSAAPGWRCTPSSLAAQEEFKFFYASDVRGAYPFFPVYQGRVFKTLQIPTTLPTMDELLGREKDINRFLLSCMAEGLNIHTIHAEVEGRPYLGVFDQFLNEICARGIKILTLADIAGQALANGKIPCLTVTRGKLPGRSGWIACQGAA